jgi:hypothetical protein
MIFRGSNIVFSPKDSDIYRDPLVNGKVRIHVADALTSEGTSMGLNIIGASNTISQITSQKQPIFKLVHSNTELVETTMKVENRAFRITHSTSTDTNPFQLNDRGLLLSKRVFMKDVLVYDY